MIRSIDVAGLALATARTLLDVDLIAGSQKEKESAARRLTTLNRDQIRCEFPFCPTLQNDNWKHNHGRSVLDLTFSVTRLALRLAMFRDLLQRHELPPSSSPSPTSPPTVGDEAFLTAPFSAIELGLRLPDTVMGKLLSERDA